MLLFLFLQSPVIMVKVGGLFQAAMLPIIAGATLYVRYKRLPREVAPGAFVSVSLWISAAVITGMMAYAIWHI